MTFLNPRFFSIGLFLLGLAFLADVATAGDWHRWRGPNGNGISDTCDIANGTSSDSDGDGVPDECGSDCVGDYDGNNQTNIDDILLVIGNWGSPYNVEDLLSVLDNFGCGG